VVLVEGRLEHITGVGEQARENLRARLSDAGRRVTQALAVRIFPDREEQFSDCSLSSHDVDAPARD